MKTRMKRTIRFGLALLAVLTYSNGVRAERLSFSRADSLLAVRNHALRTARLDVTAAEGQLAQSRRYDNPTVEVMYNVKNPTNHRWFDAGPTGETDVQVSQPFAIGGQHAELVRQNAALLAASHSQLVVAQRDLRTTVHTVMVDLYYQERQAQVYDEEITSAEKILAAYREQSDKGNIATMETQRIATMVYQLRKSRADLLLAASDLKVQLRQLLALPADEPISVDFDETAAADFALRLYLSLHGDKSGASVDALPEMTLMGNQAEAARHALRWQRSQSLPQMAVQGEYDKNGSIGHNFFAVGLSVAVPLWNHNRGNIRSAQAAVEQAAIDTDRQRLALTQQRQADLDIIGQYLKQLAEPSPEVDADLSQMLHAAEQQFMNRHISLIEFVDLYGNYRDTMLARLDAKNKMLQAAERLKIVWDK